MDWNLLFPLLEKFGSWLGPVAATIIGGWGATKFTEKSLDKRSLREARAARLTLLEEKAEEIIAGSIRAIAGKTIVELNFIDPSVRLYFDQGVIAAYESLRHEIESNSSENVLSTRTASAVVVSQKNNLASELRRFLKNPVIK